MRIICWACNFAIDASVKCAHLVTEIIGCLKIFIRAYQEIWDDSLPTLTTTLGSMIASLRPDRALVLRSTDPSREAFKTQLSTANNRRYSISSSFYFFLDPLRPLSFYFLYSSLFRRTACLCPRYWKILPRSRTRKSSPADCLLPLSRCSLYHRIY